MINKNFDEYKEIIEACLADYLESAGTFDRTLFEAMKYSLQSGGKRLRPVLLLSSCEFAGGRAEDALPYAAAIEYIHTYSLIHDDLPAMDDDELRRGRPTNHMVYGDGMAVLAGDGLLSAAFEVMFRDMLRYAGNGEEPGDRKELENRVRAAKAVSAGAGVRGMVAGQAADLESERNHTETNHTEKNQTGKNHNSSAEMLEYIHRHKTAAMIIASIKAGLHIGGAGKRMLEKMGIYAESLGLAFQIADDILDVTGNEEELGKSVGQDEKNEKLTCVSLYGMDESRRMLHKLTEQAVDAISEYGEDAGFFRELVQKLEKRTK